MKRHRMLLAIDELSILGCLNFLETALAFMAGYGLKALLIVQSLNQLDKAYGQNHSFLDNCHVRVAFATNDERTARRVSDSLGTTTEQRAMRNYAGHRLSPWLSHLMVARQETSRPLLTVGEVMQLDPADELVLVSGLPPIRAKKARYFADRAFASRLLPPPRLDDLFYPDRPPPRPDDWAGRVLNPVPAVGDLFASPDESDDGGLRREPEHAAPDAIVPEAPPADENSADPEQDSGIEQAQQVARRFRSNARNAALDQDDGMLPL